MKNPHLDAYRNPWHDKRDSGYLNHIAEVFDNWFRARNGQREQVEISIMWGMDKATGQSISLILKAHIVPKQTIVSKKLPDQG